MAARIRSLQNGINPVDEASRDDLALADVITVSSLDAATTYQWDLMFVPEGSAATFSGDPTQVSPGTFTIDLEGPYLVRLIVDAGLPSEDTQYVRLRVLTAILNLHLVSAGERRDGTGIIPVDVDAEGWANEQNANLQALEAAIAGQTWAQVLAAGNASGGTDVQMTTGDEIVGQTDVVIRSTGAATNIDLYPDAAGAVIVNGKLTVTGLIDPTGVVFDEEDPAAIPTGPNKAAIFIHDGTGDPPAKGQLYFKNSAGVSSPVGGGGGPLAATLALGNYTGGYSIVGDANPGPGYGPGSPLILHGGEPYFPFPPPPGAGRGAIQASEFGNVRGPGAVDFQTVNPYTPPAAVASGYYSSVAGGLSNTASGYFSHVAGGLRNTASSYYAHAEGYNTTASGIGAHAEGRGTTASGYYSHAEGNGTYAVGRSSHVEGWGSNFPVYGPAPNLAYGDATHVEGFCNSTNVGGPPYQRGTHAEGYGTRAWGDGAHSEGAGDVFGSRPPQWIGTFAYGRGAHAEGVASFAGYPGGMYGPSAPAVAAHAEGFRAQATGDAAHAEGRYTQAVGDNSHAEGQSTRAGGLYGYTADAAHAEGDATQAMGDFSHAEGRQSRAFADVSHAEGFQSKCYSPGNYSHAEGWDTRVYAIASHAEGRRTTIETTANHAHAEGSYTTVRAGGVGAHAEGVRSEASNQGAHAEGSDTRASGFGSHAEGGFYTLPIPPYTVYRTTASGTYSHAEGQGTVASGNPASHAEGFRTTASAQGSHAEGWQTTAQGLYSHAEGLNTQTTFYGRSAHAEGDSTTANAISAHAEGSGTQASGDNSHAEGENTLANAARSHAEGWNTIASGMSAHAEGQGSDATQTSAHAEGNYCYATAVYSHAEGRQTQATNTAAHSEGRNTIASGVTAHAENDNNLASANYASVGGRDAVADVLAALSRGRTGSWPGVRQGDAQWSNISQEVTTDGNVSVDMTGGVALRTDTTYAYRVMIVARGRNGTPAAGLSGYIVIDGVIADVAGVVGAPLVTTTTVIHDGFGPLGGGAIAATTNNNLNQLNVNVTGQANPGDFIHWHARVMLSEVGGA